MNKNDLFLIGRNLQNAKHASKSVLRCSFDGKAVLCKKEPTESFRWLFSWVFYAWATSSVVTKAFVIKNPIP